MVRRSKTRKPEGTADTQPPAADGSESPSESSKVEEVPEAAKVEKLPQAAPQKPRGREITCKQYARGKGPIGTAFETAMLLDHKKRTVKHTTEEWDEMYKRFKAQERR